jgi:hypothetical protein
MKYNGAGKLKKAFICLFISLFLAGNAAFAQQLFQPFNLDFEDGMPGKSPVAWEVPMKFEKEGYYSRIDTNNPYNGAQCVMLGNDQVLSDTTYGSCMQSIYADPFRGRRIKISAAVRTEISDRVSTAQLWISYDNETDEPGELVAMQDNPIENDEWQRYELIISIGPDAGRINYGIMLAGSGRVWMDEVNIEVIDPVEYAFEPPRPIDSVSVDNLLAFAELYGVVRFFHPSTEAFDADWNKFAVAGVRAVEDADTPGELKNKLDELFLPIAPSLQISDTSDFDNYNQPDGAMRKIALTWMHKGGFVKEQNPFFGTSVVNVYQSLRKSEGSLIQMVRAEPYRGKKLKFSAAIRTDVIGAASHAQLWMRVDKANDRIALIKNMDQNPVISGKWQRYSIEAEIPESAELIRLGLVLIGEGTVWFDDVRLEARGAEPDEESKLKNPGFEDYANNKYIPGWLFRKSVRRAGYDADQTMRGAYEGDMCLRIESDPATRVMLPGPGEQFGGKLSRGLNYSIPISLFVDTSRTLPRPKAKLNYEKYLPAVDFRADGRDRPSRLATTIVMWNIIRHFHAFDLGEAKFDAAFEEALHRAAMDSDRQKFLRTLQKLAAHLGDSQSRVWHGYGSERYGIPILWEYSSGRLIVTKATEDSEIRPGDLILEINGKTIDEIIKDQGQYISASTEEWRTVRALAELRAGPKNSTMKVKVLSDEPGEFETELKRNILLNQLTETRPDGISELEDGIFYVDMTRISDDEFKDNLSWLDRARGIIFDTRGVAVLSEYVLGFFHDRTVKNVVWQTPIFTEPFRNLVSYSYIHTPIKSIDSEIDAEAVFICDPRSIGYSFTTLALADYYDIGTIIGHSSGGIAGEIYPMRLPGRYSISLTAMKPLGPDGSVLRGREFEPEYEVRMDRESAAAGDDPYIRKAIDILTK